MWVIVFVPSRMFFSSAEVSTATVVSLILIMVNSLMFICISILGVEEYMRKNTCYLDNKYFAVLEL